MKISVSGQYLKLPVGYYAKSKKLSFLFEGDIVLEMDVNLDTEKPDAWYYADLRLWIGKCLEIDIDPDISFKPEFSDTPDTPKNGGYYEEKLRPIAHFSARNGWINDPNGLFFYNNTYHLFFQHNPHGRDWGNIHWGHAISQDLIHWLQLEEALSPDETGMVFSGSAIVDLDNVSGLKKGVHPPILLYYTAGGGYSRMSKDRNFTQGMAVSVDGGYNFSKYSDNPIIEHIEGNNRDPKVVRDPTSGLYYLALYISEMKYALFSSRNLLHWKETQELFLPEDKECPDLYPIRVENEDTYLWVFSGANDRYLIGNMNAGRFEPIQPARRLHYGRSSYAAQTFSNIEGSLDRVIRISWNRGKIPNVPFNCAMFTPTRMKLIRNRGDYLLCIQPVDEIKKLWIDEVETGTINISAKKPYTAQLNGKACDIEIVIDAKDTPDFSIDLLGECIEVLPSRNQLKFMKCSMPLYVLEEIIQLRIMTDVNGIEIYTGHGESFLCTDWIADYMMNRMIVFCAKGTLNVGNMHIRVLQNIWEPKKGERKSHHEEDPVHDSCHSNDPYGRDAYGSCCGIRTNHNCFPELGSAEQVSTCT